MASLQISVGVLSVFAVLWAALRTGSWFRRSAKITVDVTTVAKFLAFCCASLANIFAVVAYFSCLYWFVFFKQQTYLHVILPSAEQEQEIKHYVISIFVLKVGANIGLFIPISIGTCSLLQL